MKNFAYFQREFIKAILESLTVEECEILFKLAMAVAKVMTQVKPEDIEDAVKAYNTGWALMAKYRTTGEP